MNISFKKISFITFFNTSFYRAFIKLRISSPHLKSFTANFFWHCSTLQNIYVPIFKIWLLFIFIIIFHIFITIFYISIIRVAYFTLNFFLLLIAYQHLLSILILLRSFLKLLAKLMRDLKEIFLDLIHKFITTFFLILQKMTNKDLLLLTYKS